MPRNKRSVPVPNVTFKQLWANHPNVKDGGKKPCNPSFKNQCAIRMGDCFDRSGVEKLTGAEVCWFHKTSTHYLRAEELAKALSTAHVPGISPVEKISGKDFHKKISGKTGIIFFKDYWQRNGETFKNRSGDHIDLWNGSRLTDWWSWFSIHLTDSKMENSKNIWFWPVQ